MDIITIYEAKAGKSMLSRSSCDNANSHDAVDISLLTSFEVEHVDGEPDLVVELIDIFLEDVPQRLKAMRDAVTLRDATSLRGLAHSLKGSSSSLGACQLAVLCGGLEASANDLALDVDSTFLNRVEQEFERVRLAFTAERGRRLPC